MAEPVTIARPYGEAAFRLARENNALDSWSRMLSLIDAVVQDERIARCINDPNMSAAELERLVLGVCGEELDGMGRNFLQVLVQNDRLSVMPEIRALFEDLKREHEGVVEAQIISAFEVSDEQKSQLVGRLEAKYQRKMSIQFSVDPQLIGGVKIVVGDKVLDASVRGKLDAMAVALAS